MKTEHLFLGVIPVSTRFVDSLRNLLTNAGKDLSISTVGYLFECFETKPLVLALLNSLWDQENEHLMWVFNQNGTWFFSSSEPYFSNDENCFVVDNTAETLALSAELEPWLDNYFNNSTILNKLFYELPK